MYSDSTSLLCTESKYDDFCQLDIQCQKHDKNTKCNRDFNLCECQQQYVVQSFNNGQSWCVRKQTLPTPYVHNAMYSVLNLLYLQCLKITKKDVSFYKQSFGSFGLEIKVSHFGGFSNTVLNILFFCDAVQKPMLPYLVSKTNFRTFRFADGYGSWIICRSNFVRHYGCSYPHVHRLVRRSPTLCQV